MTDEDSPQRSVNSRGWRLLILGLAATGSLSVNPQASAADWTQFGWDVASSGASTDDTGITTANAEPTKGTQVADLGTGSGHWNSPIVVDGRIALPEGNANRHAKSGVLDIWSVAAPK